MFQRLPVFLIGSLVGAIIDYCVTLVLHSWLHVPAALGLALAMVISASVVFLFHQRITFATNGATGGRTYMMFMGWSVVVYVLRAGILLLLEWVGLPLELALLLAIGIASLINYTVSALRIFNNDEA